METAWIFALIVFIGIPVLGLVLNHKYGRHIKL